MPPAPDPSDDDYDQLDRDPQVARDLAYLDDLLGIPIRATDPEVLRRAKFDLIFARALARARAKAGQASRADGVNDLG